MKTPSILLAGLVLSITLADQAMALHNTVSIKGLNSVLQMKVEQDLLKTLSRDLYHGERRMSVQVKQDRPDSLDSELYSFPGCLCHLRSRVF